MTTNYHRTPLPKEARTPLGWLALWLFLLIFSPFFGFAIHGKVDEVGVIIGLVFAAFPVLALINLAARRWQGLRLTPRHILDEWKFGRVVPAEGAPMICPPVRFANKKSWIELRSEGVALSSYNFLCVHGANYPLEVAWTTQQSGQFFIPWSDATEWTVDSDSDGPDCYRVQLRPTGELRIRRFTPEAGTECELLDAVRSVGKLPIRLKCDI